MNRILSLFYTVIQSISEKHIKYEIMGKSSERNECHNNRRVFFHQIFHKSNIQPAFSFASTNKKKMKSGSSVHDFIPHWVVNENRFGKKNVWLSCIAQNLEKFQVFTFKMKDTDHVFLIISFSIKMRFLFSFFYFVTSFKIWKVWLYY